MAKPHPLRKSGRCSDNRELRALRPARTSATLLNPGGAARTGDRGGQRWGRTNSWFLIENFLQKVKEESVCGRAAKSQSTELRSKLDARAQHEHQAGSWEAPYLQQRGEGCPEEQLSRTASSTRPGRGRLRLNCGSRRERGTWRPCLDRGTCITGRAARPQNTGLAPSRGRRHAGHGQAISRPVSLLLALPRRPAPSLQASRFPTRAWET